MLRTLALATLLALAAALLAPPSAQAQELNCRVSVDYSALQGNEFTFLADLREQMEDYFNGRSWTEDRFDDFERIDCTVSVTLVEAEGLDRFRGQIAIGAQRPIYGTAQRSTVFQVVDTEWEFQYNRGQPLIYQEQRFDPLTSLLDFYALLILGYDYDTFAELGGTRYFERARAIAELGQAQGATGWVAIGDDDTRTSLVRQLLDARFLPLRRAYFLYHFGALDRFTRQPEAAWESAYSAVEALYELFLETSRRYAIDVFFATKATELVELFEDFPSSAELYALLVEMDPARSSAYDRLTQ